MSSDNSTFSIEYTRPNNHNDNRHATITLPDGTTHEVSEWKSSRLFEAIETVTEAYDEDDPDNFDDYLSTDPDERATLAMDIMDAFEGTLETRYWDLDREIVAFFKTSSIEPIEELEWLFSLTPRSTSIEFTRKHGLHLRVHYRVHEYGINYLNVEGFDREDFIERYQNKSIDSWNDINEVLARKAEHESDADIVDDDTVSEFGPRIAGTRNTALHIAWRLRENNDSRDDITATGFDTITDDDIDTALEYADNNPDEYDAYVEEQNNQQDYFDSLASDDDGLSIVTPDEALDNLPDNEELEDELNE